MIVSVLIPAVQSDPLLRATLASVRGQDLPPGIRVEVLIALRDRDDGTLPGSTVIPNPTGSIPVGLNGALARSTGEIVLRVDARCVLPADYITRCLDHLAQADIGMVGGAALVMDADPIGETYGIAFNSPLLGPSRYRYSNRSGPVGSPYLGAWRRQTLVDVGGWDERLLRNQDNELADRVTASGLKAWYDHTLVVGYRVDRSIPAMLRHHWGFGHWRMAQRSMGQEGLSRRQLTFMAGVGLVGIGAAYLVLRSPPAAGVVAAAGYATAVLVASATSDSMRARRPDLSLTPRLTSRVAAPLMAAGLDIAWLTGVVHGRIRHSTESPSSRSDVVHRLDPETTNTRP